MNLYRIFIAAVFLAAVPCMAVVSFSKQVVKVGETIEVTATPPEGFRYGSHTVAGPVTGNLGSTGGTLTASNHSEKLNDVRVTYHWLRGTGSEEETLDESNEATVVVIEIREREQLDGLGAFFSVHLTPIPLNVGARYEWRWKAKTDINNPFVLFLPPDERFTQEPNCRWYAHDKWGVNEIADYKIFCDVTIENSQITGESKLGVRLLDPGGRCYAPQVIGTVGMGYDSKTRQFFPIDNLTQIYANPVVYMPRTSQFYSKLDAHEKKHEKDHNGDFHKGYFQKNTLWDDIKHLRSSSPDDLLLSIEIAMSNWQFLESERFEKDRDILEKRALSVSDRIPPKYFYQKARHDL